MKKILIWFILICFYTFGLLSPASMVLAQDENTGLLKNSVEDLEIIGWIGVGGAVLGLSTLPFVEEPKNHLKNVYVGGAIGIIIGVGVVAWKQAQKSSLMYKEAESASYSPRDFNTLQRLIWHDTESSAELLSVKQKSAPQIVHTFTF